MDRKDKMQVEPSNTNRNLGRWMGASSTSSSARSRGEGDRSNSGGGGGGKESRPESASRKTFRNFRAGDDLEADWNTDDSSSLSEFVQKRYMSQPPPKATAASSAAFSDNQPKAAIKRASARMRRRREKQDMKKNGLNELLEMPKWEHPVPSSASRGKRSVKGDASSKGSTALRQLLDGGDDDSDSELEDGNYLQNGIISGKRNSGGAAKSGASRSSVKKGSEGSTASSASRNNIPLHLESDIETDDESTGVELFQSGKKSYLDDDDGSISSASVECFKPKPSKQEMAATLLRSFDHELRMAAEKSQEPRNSERQSPKLANSSVSKSSQSSSSVSSKSSKPEPPVSGRLQCLQNPAPARPTARHVSTDNVRPIPPRSAPRTSSLPQGVTNFFNTSLRLDDLELDGSIGDLEALTNDLVAERQQNNNNDHSGSNGSSSSVSVDILSDQEKEDLEEKMIRIAMERSLGDSGSFLDDVAQLGNAEEPEVYTHPETMDIGSEDEDDDGGGTAEMVLERELLRLAMQRSLNESKISINTATTNTAVTSEESGSSAWSSATDQSHTVDRGARAARPVRRSGGDSAASTGRRSIAGGDSTVGSTRSRGNPRPRPSGSVNKGDPPLRRVQRPGPRRGSASGASGAYRERRSSGSHGPTEKRTSTGAQNVRSSVARRQPRSSRPVQDI